ncbi:hypothetical protein GCM10010433_45420 [Streptomyces pulveraceus]|uniref:AraC family transcriptional regulator n=1 Tax=Streptomyces pulveraceus TaxID=68258 RepID=A0ABW1GKB2_9ACTN
MAAHQSGDGPARTVGVAAESGLRVRDQSFRSALVPFVHAITGVPDIGWSSRHVIGPPAGARALTGLFVVAERRSGAPRVPFGAPRSRSLVGGDLLLLVT